MTKYTRSKYNFDKKTKRLNKNTTKYKVSKYNIDNYKWHNLKNDEIQILIMDMLGL